MRHGGNVWALEDPSVWLDFSANLRPEGPPEWALEAMRRAVSRARYYPDRTMARARQGLAAYLRVPQDRLLPTAGGAAAIDLALSLARGRVLITPPTFGEYAERARAHGRAVETYTGDVREGDTIVLCNPNNPTGALTPADGVLHLKEHVAERGGTLLVDEAFIDFCPPEASVRRFADERMIVVGSLTKILGVPGARLGYAVAGEENIRAMEALALPWSLNAMASEIASALPEHALDVRKDARINAARRAELTGWLEALGACPAPSQANFLLADFRRDMTLPVARLRRERILVRTCDSFGLGRNFLRLAVRTREENARLMAALRRALADTREEGTEG